MKIIFTVNKYKPNLDGVQFVTSYLAEGLAKNGHEVIVITSSYTRIPAPDEEKICDVNIKRLKIRTSHTFHIGNKKEYQKLILDITKDSDCLINVGTQSPFTDWCFEILDQIKTYKILYLHSIWDMKYCKEHFESIKTILFKIWANLRWKLYYIKNKKIFKKYNKIIQLHEKDYSSKFFEKRYNIKSEIIENAADDNFFEKDDNVDFKKPFKEYIIYVANYIRRKNQKLAISEFLNSQINPDVGLVLIGSYKTKYYQDLIEYEKKKRKELNIDSKQKPIIILTDVDRILISQYVKNATLYLLSSMDEKFPISIVESMAASIPYISTDVGIVKYLPGGVVSDSNEIHYWIEKLYNDEVLRKNMGKTGHDFASKHMKIEKKVSQLEKIILDLKKERKYE